MLTEHEIRVAREAGFSVRRETCKVLEATWDVLTVTDEDVVGAVRLSMKSRPDGFAIIHRTTHPGSPRWQVSYFDAEGASGHTCRQTLTDALDVARSDGFSLSSVRHQRAAAPREEQQCAK